MASAYLGTTAPSSTTNPPINVTSQFGGAVNSICPGNRFWYYCSTNTSTEATTLAFFSDGVALGMKVGDIVFAVYQTSVGSTSPIPYMGCIAASTGATCTLGSLTS